MTAGARPTAAAVALLAAAAAGIPGTVHAQGYNPAVNYGLPNFANSPNLRKFVDSLPGVGLPGCVVGSPANGCNENNLGQYIPLAAADTTSYPGSDYYEIGLRAYHERMHSDLPATALRGYYQINGLDHTNQYLGPLILAQRNRPVRIVFRNELPLSTDAANAEAPFGNLPLPVDTTVMGAGMGPLGGTQVYTQNRATIHLHGGLSPWISDGTPHQWVTPAADPTPYKKGDAFQNVPDMVGAGKSIPAPAAGDGLASFFYPNEQSARLMFYHDHAYGITRLNVYAGEAAGYLLTDPVEEDLITGANATGNGLPAVLPDLGGVYHWGIPLVIQDRTFVNDPTTHATASANLAAATAAGLLNPVTGVAYQPSPLTSQNDPRWSWGAGGNLWFPHEYMPNQDLYSATGQNPLGRWDYGPWMNPPMVVQNPVLPTPTLLPESFGDTMLVNGAAFPYATLPPQAIRLRILNACNDRALNLQLYYAATPGGVVCDGVRTDPATGAVPPPDACTEVSMVPAAPNAAYPTWPKDGRAGGVPDPSTGVGQIVQIGNEGGFLVKPAVWPNQPIDFDYNRKNVTFGGVTSHALLLMSGMRADVIVDLFGVAPGAVVMLYNDAPAPMPLFDSRNDYFTDAPDLTTVGGALPTPPGFGPNTRTVMQIRVAGTTTQAAPYDVNALAAAMARAYAIDQEAPVVPQTAYNAAFPGIATSDVYAKAYDEALNVSGTAQPVSRIVTTVPGQGYATPPTVVFTGGFPAGCAAPTCVPATATARLNGVTGIILTTGGSGYTAAPTVTIGAPGAGGIQATAVATVSGGVVTAVTVINPGSNYAVAPAVTFTGGGAAVQATATASIITGSVGAITLTSGGTGYVTAPLITLTGGGGRNAAAVAMLAGSLVMDGKNIVEGFDMEFGRMNAVLGSTPNPLTPNVGAGPVIGPMFYVDPPTEIIPTGNPLLWRITHIGVDSHAVHFHLFNVQVVNRVDWGNVIKPPYPDELGWRETIRTNPFEDVIVAIRPAAMKVPFAMPDSNRLLDTTTLPGSTANFTPAPPPPGTPAVAGTTNLVTNFHWEYVWHCHLLGHEENDMMRPIVFVPTPPGAAIAPTTLAFGPVLVGTTSAARAITVSNNAPVGSQSLVVTPTVTGAAAVDYHVTNGCAGGLSPARTCPVLVTILPSTTGARNATLRLATNDPANPTFTIPLTATGVAPPAAPTLLTTTGMTPTSISLRWRDGSNNETAFAIWRSTSGGPFAQIATVARTAAQSTAVGGNVNYADGTVALGTTYAYYVVATNAVGASPPSNTLTVALAAPGAPTLNPPTAVTSTATRDRVTLTWTPGTGIPTGWTVQRATDAAFTVGLTTANVTGGATVTWSQNTPRATTYHYRIAGVNALGTGPWSNTVSILTP
jgi:FtsP/CotA-like multicopper oxidase with cupredoxin domain